MLGWKYLLYILRAKNRHGIHPPFIYDLVSNAIYSKTTEGSSIEKLRAALKKSSKQISFNDYGKEGVRITRKVSSIAQTSLKPKKYAQLLMRLCRYLKVENAVELGTSLGITTAYLSKAVTGKVFSFEGGKEVMELARTNWKQLGITNIEGISGPFHQTFLIEDPSCYNAQLFFVDGNHQLSPTLTYFEHIVKTCGDEVVLVFDDIHWSADMEEAWSIIKSHERVSATVDLFFIGIVFLRPGLTKAHFEVRY